MNFEEVVACLKNTEKREEFILRLQNAGENSKPFLHVQSAMVELKMNKAPRGIDEKTILQHTLKFTDPDECFQSFRLVCKSWKDAVETIKFNRTVPSKIFINIDKIIKNGLPILPYFEKYLQCFKKLWAPMEILASENGHLITSLILNNMGKLNSIWFEATNLTLPETVNPFMLQMLKNSHETLQTTRISRFCIPDISFPKLKILEIVIGKDICLPEFKTYFPLVLKNMERLQTVTLRLSGSDYVGVCKYIIKNYGKHCISATASSYNILHIVPAKIVTGVLELEEDLQNAKYVSGLQYLHVIIDSIGEPMGYGWDKYQEILDQCLNLKAVEFTWFDENSSKTTLSQISEPYQNIWQERMSYFKARGIRIVDDGEIDENEHLQTKLAKQAGVTWKFHFH